MAGSSRPYRDFMTPALHRRFASASLFNFALCYLLALWMGGLKDKGFFWWILPLGPTGVRAALLFIATLIVYILRVAQMHVGRRTSPSPASTLRHHVFSVDPYRTAIAYMLSAWLFCEVYIWTRSSSDRLDFTDPGKYHERIRLNERPIILRSLFVFFAIGQAVVHLWKDYDRIPIPLPRSSRTARGGQPVSLPKPASLWQILAQAFPRLKISAFMSISFTIAGPILYYMLCRTSVWNWHYSFAKYIVSLPKNSRPTGPGGLIDLLVKFLVESFCLSLLWELSNTTFDEYMSREPLKKGKPITNDSKDPNGSLLNGLKSKKEIPKNIALWELSLISEKFDDRRSTIFGELEKDRKHGAAWSQIVGLCLTEIKAIGVRIEGVMSPGVQPTPNKKTPEMVQLVPRISSPLKNEKIAGPGEPPATRLQKFEAFASDVARSHSSPENAANTRARKMLEQGSNNLNHGMKASVAHIKEYRGKIVSSPWGTFFRKTPSRLATTVIAGTPRSQTVRIANAVSALTNLAALSLAEDILGQFYKQVPDIIRVFATVIRKVESYLAHLQFEWVDTKVKGDVPEVEAVLDALKDGLERLLGAFAEYLPNMLLSAQEVQEAKEAASKRGAWKEAANQ